MTSRPFGTPAVIITSTFDDEVASTYTPGVSYNVQGAVCRACHAGLVCVCVCVTYVCTIDLYFYQHELYASNTKFPLGQ